jgi:hypothetical protein
MLVRGSKSYGVECVELMCACDKKSAWKVQDM